MTDYELYQVLDKNGYEPSVENLSLLKEQLISEIDQVDLEEGLIYAHMMGKSLVRNSSLAKKYEARQKKAELEGDNEKAEKNKKKLEKANLKIDKATRYAEDKKADGAKLRLDTMSKSARKLDRKQKTMDKSFKYLSSFAKTNNNNNNNTNSNSNNDTTSNENTNTNSNVNEALNVLSIILESNGFETSENNIEILCENIVNDEYDLFDSSDVILTEDMDPDYVYMQILDNNGFDVTENNVNVLKEAIDNGHVLLIDLVLNEESETAQDKEDDQKAKDVHEEMIEKRNKTKRRKNMLKQIKNGALKVAASTIIGAGAGAIVGSGSKLATGIGAGLGASAGTTKAAVDIDKEKEKNNDKMKKRFATLHDKGSKRTDKENAEFDLLRKKLATDQK